METQKKTVLPNIDKPYLVIKGNHYHCLICMVDMISQDSQNHEADLRHVGALRRFNMAFEKLLTFVSCRYCNKNFEWSALKEHAISHRVEPWYVPPDMYKNFYKNHLIEWESQFYCSACDVFLPEWSTACLHTIDRAHRKVVDRLEGTNDLSRLTLNEELYKTLVTNAFGSYPNSSTVWCRICDCRNIGIRNVESHVRGAQHTLLKYVYLILLMDQRDCKSKDSPENVKDKKAALNPNPNDSEHGKDVSAFSDQRLPCLYIVKDHETKFYCIICELVLPNFTVVSQHAHGDEHSAALRKYGCEYIRLRSLDYVYQCYSCGYQVLGIKNVHQHTMGFRHKNSVAKERRLIGENLAKTQAQSASEAVFPFLSQPAFHIENVIDRGLVCKLCNEDMPVLRSLDQHFMQATHRSKEQLLLKYIVFKGGNEYYCNCCSWAVPGIENVYDHINGNRHVKSLSDLGESTREASNEALMKIESTKQLQIIASPQSMVNQVSLGNDHTEKQTNGEFPKDHIEKQTNGESLCKLCNEVIPRGSNIREHITKAAHQSTAQLFSKYISLKEGNKYYCSCCSCAVPGIENVYRHIKGNRHANSLSDLGESTREASNEALTKIETPKQLVVIASPQSIVNYPSPANDHTEKQTNGEFPKDHIEKQTNGEFLCRLCNKVIPCGSNILEHLTKATHWLKAQLLSKYISFKEGNKYYCRCCSCAVPGIENVYRHIKGNRHANSLSDLGESTREASNEALTKIETPKQLVVIASPQSIVNYPSPANDHSKKQINGDFPKDHIEKQTNGESLCRLCNEVIPYGSNIREHLTKAAHQSTAQLFSKYISLKEGNKYYCSCCSCAVPGIENVYGHIKGPRHANSLSDLGESAREASNEALTKIETPKQLVVIASPQSIVNYPSPATDHTEKQVNREFPKDHIEKQTNGESLCRLCNEVIPYGSNIREHLTKATHQSKAQLLSKYISLKEGNNYYCSCCSCTVPGIENLYGHIKGNRHANSLSDLGESAREASNEALTKIETPKQLVVIASPQSIVNYPSPATDHTEKQVNREFPKDHIEKQTNGESLCRLCNEVIPYGSNIREHLTKATHQSKAQLLSKTISFKGGNGYYCRCCSCAVPGIENVYRHVNGVKHANSLSDLGESAREASNEALTKIETPKQLVVIASPQSIVNCPPPANDHTKKQTNGEFPKDHIEKQTNGESLCRLCNEVIPYGSNIQEHLTKATHQSKAQLLSKYISLKEGNNYYCNCCSCTVPGIENLYGHIKGNRHANSLSDLGESAREASNEALTKIETPKQLVVIASPQFIVNYPSPATDHTENQVNGEFPKDHIEKQTNGESLCRLCNEVIPYGSNIREHLTKATHQSKAQLLSKTISFKGGNGYYCRCCSCAVPGIENVYRHVNGVKHANSLSDLGESTRETSNEALTKIETPKQLVVIASPQSIVNCPPPANDHTKKQTNGEFPKDHIEKQTNGESLCRLCNEVIPYGSNIREHLTKATHQSKAQLLSKYISLKEGNNYYCSCCSCTVPGIENLYGHIKGNRHANSLKNLDKHEVNASTKDKIETTKPLKTFANPQPVTNDLSLAADRTKKETNEEWPEKYIEKQTNGELLCQLCNVFIWVGSTVQEHLRGQTHLLKVHLLLQNISFKEGNQFYCRCCDCIVLGTKNVYSHVNSTRHAVSLNESKHHENGHENSTETARKSEEVAESACESSSHDHIVKLSDTTFCCKICDDQNVAYTLVDEHVMGKRHAEAFKRFTDDILLGKKDKHYCTCCNCIIIGIDNIYTHLREAQHLSFHNTTVEAPKIDSTNLSDCIEIREEMTESAKLSKPASPFLQADFPLENIPCSFCNLVFVHFNDFHSHMTSHVNKEIQLPDNFERINGTKDSSPEREYRDQNGIAGSQLTKGLEDLEQVEREKFRAEASSNGSAMNGSTVLTRDSNLVSPASLESDPAKCNGTPERSRRLPKTMGAQGLAELLDVYNDRIHDMRDKLRETQLGMKLCFTSESGNIYCLVCRKQVPETTEYYFEHLSTVEHCEYLEQIEKDHALFELVPNQYSEYDLVYQYMEEISEDLVRCHACAKDVNNLDYALELHISDKNHQDICKLMNFKAKANFESIKPQLQCDWYEIHKYSCLPCSKVLESEISFVKHLRSTGHAIVMRKSINERVTVYDFCSPCALLWFGFRCSYANHRESSAHKAMLLKELNRDLPTVVAILCTMADDYVTELKKHIEKTSAKTRAFEETLTRDLEMAVKLKFPDVTVHPYVSRTSGLRAENDDFEIFLDCDNMYDGKEPPQHEVLYLMTSVHQCLAKDPQRWDLDTLLSSCQSFVLKARHRASELTCRISFENGLPVENAKLIMYFVDIFPPCGDLLLFLSEWLLFCNLAGPQGISYNALYWCVIFYLQTESVLPSVASLKARRSCSRLIAGWEVGVSLDRTRVSSQFCNLSTTELLTRFFTFYAKFDYRYNVVCPLLGRKMKKQAFVETQSLPKEMALYVDSVKNATDSRLFRIDNVMCVQDPLNLQRNLTESVSKASLMYFRAYCSKSLDVL